MNIIIMYIAIYQMQNTYKNDGSLAKCCVSYSQIFNYINEILVK